MKYWEHFLITYYTFGLQSEICGTFSIGSMGYSILLSGSLTKNGPLRNVPIDPKGLSPSTRVEICRPIFLENQCGKVYNIRNPITNKPDKWHMLLQSCTFTNEDMIIRRLDFSKIEAWVNIREVLNNPVFR